MPSRPVLIGRGLVTQTLNQNHKHTTHCMLASTTTHHTTPTPPRLGHTTTTQHAGQRGVHKSYGGHSERETPGPIPNPEVKPFSADGTATERLWESRTPPDILSTRGHPLRVAPGCISGAFLRRRSHVPSTGARPDGVVHRRAPRDAATVGAAARLARGGDVHVSTAQTADEPRAEAVNEVRLVGRVSQAPEERVLPSGDIAVDVPGGGAAARRPARRAAAGRRARVRACGAARVRRSVASWRVDDVVEVSGRRAPTVLPDRARRGVAGRGRGRRRPAHSSRSERMSTPEAGLGLEGGGLLRQQPVVADDPEDQCRSRAPASARRRRRCAGRSARVSSTEWW